MFINQENKEVIRQQALRESPKECCGVFYIPEETMVPVAMPCQNIDEDPINFFTVSPNDYLTASLKGKIGAYYHSHLESDTFSDFDRLVAEKFKLGCIMYHLPTDKFYEYSPIGYELPLVGRQYTIGFVDCFSLVKDYYFRNLNILLPEFTHPYRGIEHKSDHPDNNSKHDVLPDYFLLNGFSEVKSVKEGDVILMNTADILSPVHCAIYKAGNHILHHPFKKISKLDLYKDIHKKYTTHIFRHNLLV